MTNPTHPQLYRGCKISRFLTDGYTNRILSISERSLRFYHLIYISEKDPYRVTVKQAYPIYHLLAQTSNLSHAVSPDTSWVFTLLKHCIPH